MSTATRTETPATIDPVMYAGALIKGATDVLEEIAQHPVHKKTICLGAPQEALMVGHPARIDIVSTTGTEPAEELTRMLAHHAGIGRDEMRGHLEGGGDTKLGTVPNGTEARRIVRTARENGTEVDLKLHDDTIEVGEIHTGTDPVVHVIAKRGWSVSVDSIAIVRELSGRKNTGREFVTRHRNTEGDLYDVVRHIPAGWAAAIADELKIKGFSCVSVRHA